MLARTIKVTDGPNGLQPIGTELYGKDAWRLVVLGVAEPADQECLDKIDELEAGKDSQALRREFVAAERAALSAVQQPATEAKPKPVAAVEPIAADEADTETE